MKFMQTYEENLPDDDYISLDIIERFILLNWNPGLDKKEDCITVMALEKNDLPAGGYCVSPEFKDYEYARSFMDELLKRINK